MSKNTYMQNEIARADRQHVVDNVEHSIDRMLVSEAIQKLPCDLREVVILFYYQEMSARTIGNILHIPRTTVEFRLKKARGELRKVIREDCL